MRTKRKSAICRAYLQHAARRGDEMTYPACKLYFESRRLSPINQSDFYKLRGRAMAATNERLEEVARSNGHKSDGRHERNGHAAELLKRVDTIPNAIEQIEREVEAEASPLAPAIALALFARERGWTIEKLVEVVERIQSVQL